MEGIMHYRSLSPHYDVFDIKGDGNDQVMGVQYYIAFRHTNARVAKQIWAQNNRKDFYAWLYGDEINYGPIGKVTFKEAYGYKFLKRKALQGKSYSNISLYEAPYEKEYLQFYIINGVNKLSKKEDWVKRTIKEFDRVKEEMNSFLENTIRQWEQKGFDRSRMQACVSHGGSRAGTIVDEARRGGFGTIVVGRRGLTKVEEFFMGRVSNKVLQMAREMAVWIVH